MNIKNYNVHPPIFFIIEALMMSYLLPRDAKLKSKFNAENPWPFGLLTDQTNFHTKQPDS